jgi:hypothetical protein
LKVLKKIIVKIKKYNRWLREKFQVRYRKCRRNMKMRETLWLISRKCLNKKSRNTKLIILMKTIKRNKQISIIRQWLKPNPRIVMAKTCFTGRSILLIRNQRSNTGLTQYRQLKSVDNS